MDGQPDLAGALAAARQPVEPCPLPPTHLRQRVETSRVVRRALPSAVMVGRAEAHGRALWLTSAAERERALAAMDAVVGGTTRAHEVEPLAHEHVVEAAVKETLFWQPWRTPTLDAPSEARLRAALASGRGVLLSTCHMGPFLHGMSVISALGRTPYSVSSWTSEPPAPGYWGRRVARRRREARARDERLVHAAGSFPLLRALLAEREIVSVFFAVPGGRETMFLGKPVMLASGSARLAEATDALIVPLRNRRSGHRVLTDVEAPIDPREHAGADELHEALAAVHERWILELPASMEDPNRAGAWENTASASAWLRPQPRERLEPVAS